MRAAVQSLCGGGEDPGGCVGFSQIVCEGSTSPQLARAWTNRAMTNVIGSDCEGWGIPLDR